MNAGKQIKTRSAEETKKLGRQIGQSLKSSAVIALSGRLGAGKTTLIAGIAEGLKVKDCVTSPSFTLVNEYKGKIPLYHIDLYRLDNYKEIEDLGIEEYFEKKGITIIEWAEKMGKRLPADSQKIEIEVIDENTRNIKRY